MDMRVFLTDQKCLSSLTPPARVYRYDRWIAMARAAIACWLATARRLGVVKDIRLLIAQKLWDERAEWSRVRPNC
jgi:hypothetical protein